MRRDLRDPSGVEDAAAGEVRLHAAPAAPPGFAVVGVDVVVRLKRLG